MGASIGWCTSGLHVQTIIFFIYMNDLTKYRLSTTKLFTDDTSIVSVTKDSDESADRLNKDLQKVSDWSHQWKMSFNHDISKQA